MDIRLALMTGIDIPIPECHLVLHQPSIKEISYLGEEDFFKGLQTICLDKSMFSVDNFALETLTNFQIFMTVMMDESTKEKKKVVKDFLNLTFPHYQILFTPQSLLLRPQDGESIIIDESNFTILQETFKEVFCVNKKKEDEISYNPVGKKAKEIYEKIMKGRQKVAELKAAANGSIFSQYLSSLCIGLHISLLELTNYTMYQIFDLIERLGLYTAWDVDLRCRLAGGSPDEQPENWMKNIH